MFFRSPGNAHTVRTGRPRSQLQRADNLSIFAFAESLQRFGADVSLRRQADNCLRIAFIIRRIDYANEVVPAHRQVCILDFDSALLEGFASGVEPARTIFDARNSLLRPVEQCNVSWHGPSSYQIIYRRLFSLRRIEVKELSRPGGLRYRLNLNNDGTE